MMKQTRLEGGTVVLRAAEPDIGRPWPNDFSNSRRRRFERRWEGGKGW